jgi:CHAT domain-containing protein/Flp pilus assembly protein TadD
MYSRTFLKNRVLAPALVVIILIFLLDGLLTDHQRRVSLARGLLQEWKLTEAVEVLRVLAEDQPGSIEVRRMYAACLLKRGELTSARNEFVLLARLDSSSYRDHLLSLGFAYYYLGHLDSSAKLANEIAQEAAMQNDSVALARSFHLLGRIAFNQARYDSALLLQQLSLRCAQASGSLQGQADATRQIGVLYWYRGRSDTARVLYEMALETYRKLGDKIGEATTINNIGLIDGNPQYFLEAFAIRRTIGDQIGLADSYYFVTYDISGHWTDVAFAFHKKAFELSSKIGYAWGREVAARAMEHMAFESHDSLHLEPLTADTAHALSPEGRILQLQLRSSDYFRRGKLQECADLRERLVLMCDSLGYKQGLATALDQYAVALVLLGECEKAEEVANRFYQLSPFDGRRALARIHMTCGRYHKASQLLVSLIDQLDQDYSMRLRQNDVRFSVNAPAILVNRYQLFTMLLGSLSRLRNNSAIFDALEKFRSLPLGFGIERPGAKMNTGEESIWHRYIRTLEEIEHGSREIDELMAEFGDEHAKAKHRHATSVTISEQMLDRPIPAIKEIQHALEPHQVLLEYFVGTDSAYVLALRRDTSAFVTLATPVRDLNSSVRTMVDLLLRERTTPGSNLWKKPARFLFSSLLEPLIMRRIVRDGDHLIISPHGILHYLPFAPLLDCTDQFAVERFILSTVPSAAQMLAESTQQASSSALALAPNTKSLTFGEQELASIPEELFPERIILLDDRATAREFLQGAPNAGLIHLAAHGRMHRWHPLFSYLEMADRPLELHRVLSSKLSAQLVVVSACETGYGVGMLGEITDGHSVVNFPHAFLSAGASAVIAPLWIVEDESSARLFRLFYSHLTQVNASVSLPAQGSYAKALTLAQRQFVQDARSHRSTEHPFYWAGFYLMGYPN